jgi:predicted DNA-binding transcriptional regulator AlpA
MTNTELLSTRDVEVLTRLSGPAITKLIQAGKFPRPILIGSSHVHRRDAVEEWLSTRPRVRRGGRLEYRHELVV